MLIGKADADNFGGVSLDAKLLPVLGLVNGVFVVSIIALTPLLFPSLLPPTLLTHVKCCDAGQLVFGGTRGCD